MMTLKERMPMLLEMRREHLVTLQANAADPDKDRNGSSSSSVKQTLRFIGVAEFVMSGNAALFRQCLSEAAKIHLQLFDRRSKGEPIDDSYVAMLSYKDLFDGLAAADFGTAEQLAQHMGGRPELETKHDHSFDHCLGYTLKAFVLRTPSEMAAWISRFSVICREADNVDFAGYAGVFNAILARDERLVQRGLSTIVKGHKNQSKAGGVFKDLEDETLCVWGVGIANLARHVGLAIKGDSPFIPQELLL
jgi:hypothetical protein